MQPQLLASRAIAFLLSVIAFAGFAIAQSDNSNITGVVVDPSGSVVPQAQILVVNELTGVQRTAATNDMGVYTVTLVPPGTYKLVVQAPGFRKTERRGNQVLAGVTATMNVSLQVGSLDQTVEVTTAASPIQADTASLGRTIDRDQIQNVQLNGRNPLFLALLKPGVLGGSLAGFNYANLDGTLNVNGGRGHDNQIYTDGASTVRTRAAYYSVVAQDVESLQEIQVLTANYAAEYGGVVGGQIRMVTRSGGRDFHGAVYEYFRNAVLDANDWARNRNADPSINSRPSPFRYNQFGYTASGPVFIPNRWNTGRNKLFFLWSQEYVRNRSTSSASMKVPSLNMRAGDFSELLNASNPYIAGVQLVKDPASGNPFPGNVIPSARLSTNGIGLLKAYPQPNGWVGAANWTASGGAWRNQRKDTVAIDYNLNDTNFLRFRLQNYTSDYRNPFDQGSDRTPALWSQPGRTVSLNHVSTLSPTLVNEVLATVSVDHTRISLDLSSGAADRTKYGIDFPYIYAGGKEIANKIPTVQVTGFAQLSGSKYPAKSAGPIYRMSDTLTKITGNHTLKFGFQFDRSGENDFDQVNFTNTVPGGSDNQNGAFAFTNTRTGGMTSGVAIANAALGLFDTYAEIGTRAYTPYRAQMYEWFAQDAWKVTPKLRVEYGVRHSLIQPWYSLWGNQIVFDPRYYDSSKAVGVVPATGRIVSGADYNGMVIPGNGWPAAAKGRVAIADTGEYNYLFRPGVGKSYSDFHSKDFQPRLGIAYSLSDKQVIRAGIGRAFQRTYAYRGTFLGGQAPFQPMGSVALGSADNPGGGSTTVRVPLVAFAQDPIYKNPETWAWNVSYQRQFWGETSVELSYVGRRSLHLPLLVNINQLQPGTLQKNPGVNTNALRPYLGYAQIIASENAADATYRALQLNVSRRFSHGLGFGIAYTYSSSWDTASAYNTTVTDAYHIKSMWGRSNFDTPHVLVINYLYEIPLLKGNTSLLGKVGGGWQLTGVSQFQSGTPASVTTGDDFAGIGAGSGNQYWAMNGDPSLPAGEQAFSQGGGDSNFWFRAKTANGQPIFTAPAAGTFAPSFNRGVLRQPGFQNWNIGLMKTFRINDRSALRFQAESFNFVNHPNWNGADTNPRNPTFGHVTGKSGARNLQLALRYMF